MFNMPQTGISGMSLFNVMPDTDQPVICSVDNLTRIPVDSSYLKSVGYDDDDGIMEVEFQDGAIYQYDVPHVSDFWDLLDADSKGQKFYYDFRTSVPFWRIKGHD